MTVFSQGPLRVPFCFKELGRGTDFRPMGGTTGGERPEKRTFGLPEWRRRGRALNRRASERTRGSCGRQKDQNPSAFAEEFG